MNDVASYTEVFEEFESEVRTYCRRFPIVIQSARNHLVRDVSGRQFIDFMSGAGALNYGHNNAILGRAIQEYIERNGVTHSLDFYTEAKARFIRQFCDIILRPRGLDYKLQFTGPTGTNAVEAAMKLARRVTRRPSIIAFTNGFHGMTLGALAAAGSERRRASAGVALNDVSRMPFDGYMGPSHDTMDYLEACIGDPSSGVAPPAAFLLEVVQGEGGLAVASDGWLRRLASLAKRNKSLLIVDDIQAGCGRTGDFFSFERSGIKPDVVCLAKSIGGFGLPLALVLIERSLDQQQPGEHVGTFRGNNLAFVAGAAAFSFWSDPQFLANLEQNVKTLDGWLHAARDKFVSIAATPGRGMMRGVEWKQRSLAGEVSAAAFERGVLVETCGAFNQVLKLMPPLTIDVHDLQQGLTGIDAAMTDVIT